MRNMCHEKAGMKLRWYMGGVSKRRGRRRVLGASCSPRKVWSRSFLAFATRVYRREYSPHVTTSPPAHMPPMQGRAIDLGRRAHPSIRFAIQFARKGTRRSSQALARHTYTWKKRWGLPRRKHGHGSFRRCRSSRALWPGKLCFLCYFWVCFDTFS